MGVGLIHSKIRGVGLICNQVNQGNKLAKMGYFEAFCDFNIFKSEQFRVYVQYSKTKLVTSSFHP